jgi:hypothetical protein
MTTTTATTTAPTTVYVALVGSDGYRALVWGLGVGVCAGVAARDARADAEQYDYPGDVEELDGVEIDAATARRIEDGEIDAVSLGLARR